MKEMVLSKAWSKRIITIGERRIFFDHDYPSAVVQQRKSYVKAKKILKEAGIRFQTPFTKMRVHWNNGVKTYNDAKEVEKDLRDRGYKVADSEEAEGTTNAFGTTRGKEKLGLAAGHQRAERRGKQKGTEAARGFSAKERSEFVRDPLYAT
ncbi:Isopropylmalate/citramalate isomerase large subunit [Labeo rohita]|uniref:Isopropylmalate/citramalate isomerase large subunit n=1 Tax=Labeo rohita TaxID=84645 RepID=A0ABQ8L4L5_LABRO|nr:Isopropylmalate/citramalate isomerase large subunit [Labeo rohita]